MATHALTIDLEDWHSLQYRRITGETVPTFEQVVPATRRLLDMLEDLGVRATFFVLGLVADTHPGLIREIAGRGHEIGSHSYAHRLISALDEAGLRADLDRSRKQLQDITGQPVLGFRAPEFSVGRLDHWCFDVLREVGFTYDSSVFPVSRARYGLPDAPDSPFVIRTRHGDLAEFPLATWQWGHTRLPVAGGTWYRLVPSRLLELALRRLDDAGKTAILYCHPYEFSPGWLYLRGLGLRGQLHRANVQYTLLHNFATSRIEHRLRALLSSFQFAPVAELLSARPPHSDMHHEATLS